MRNDLPMREIVGLYRSGQSTKQIAAKYDSCDKTISRNLLKSGVSLRISASQLAKMRAAKKRLDARLAAKQSV